jgi:hypothetical protein
MQSTKKSQTQRRPKPKKAKVAQAKPKSTNPVVRVVKAPVAVGTVGRVRVPRYRTGKNGSVLVSHCELLGDVIGSNAYSVSTYTVNAGLPLIFNWLSSIASNYESYKFKRLRFRYESACTTATPGFVYAAVDFDASDPAPLTEQAIANYEGVKYGSPWVSHIYDCAAHNLGKRTSYFVRNGPLLAGQDVLLYDVGTLQIATTGNGGTPLLGKVWVEYDVELSTPQLTQNGIGRALSGKIVGSDDNATVPVQTGILPLVPTVAGNVLTLTASQPVQLIVDSVVTGTGIGNPTFGGTGVTTTLGQLADGAGTAYVKTVRSILNPGQTLTIDWAATTVTNYTLRGSQYLYTLA